VPSAPFVIVNPTAGGGRARRVLAWLRERLDARPEARLEVTRRAGDAERWAADAAVDGYDRVVAVGGDGTIQEVINGLVDGGPTASLGIVPVGGGNDLARSLGLPRDAGECWSLAVGARERTIDLALARDRRGRERWFSSAGGIGYDALVAQALSRHAGWRRSRAGYLVTALAELWRFTNRHVEVTIDGRTEARTIMLMAISNGAYYGGGMRISPTAEVDDGLLDLCVVGDLSRFAAIRQIPNLYRGTHVNHPAVEIVRARHVVVDGGADTLVHLDGETFGHLPLEVELRPARLVVAAPAALPSATS
jgi:YegS/Rv2252/BmrU family lipid kinase